MNLEDDLWTLEDSNETRTQTLFICICKFAGMSWINNTQNMRQICFPNIREEL